MPRKFNDYEVRFSGMVKIRASTACEAAERVKGSFEQGRPIDIELEGRVTVHKTAEVTEFEAIELVAAR